MARKHHQVPRNGRRVDRFASRPARTGDAGSISTDADRIFDAANATLAAGKIGEAIQKYVEALKLKPKFPEALCNLGSALSRLERPGSSDAAIERFQRAIAIDPGYALAHNNLGAALMTSGRIPEALKLFERAVELSPEYIDARCNLAAATLKLGRRADAAAEYQRVLGLKPSNSIAREALLNLADWMESEGRYVDAVSTRAAVVQHRARDWQARVRLAMTQPVIAESTDEIIKVRARIAKSLAQLLHDGIRLEDPYRQLAKPNFYFAYHGLNDRELQRTIANFHLAACPELGWVAPHCHKPIAHHGKLRLGIVCEYLNDHTIGKLYRGIIEELSRERSEIILMRADRQPDAATAEIDSLANSVVQFPRRLTDARDLIAAQSCHVIFYPEIGMDEFTYYLAFARLAPVQCASWGIR